MPAEKAIYRPDFVKLFFVHYATVTTLSQMGKPEIEKSGQRFKRKYKFDVGVRYTDEETEATMLHTKAVTSKEILYWKRGLQAAQHNSKLGVEKLRNRSVGVVFIVV